MCNRHIYFSETCTVSLKYRFRLQIRFEKHRFHCSEHEFAKTTSLISLHPLRTFPGTFSIVMKKCLAKKCSSLPHFPRHFFHKKCLEKSVRCNQAAISWRASGNRQISLNASAERAFANFRDKKHRILQLQIFATKTSFLHIFATKTFFTNFATKNCSFFTIA